MDLLSQLNPKQYEAASHCDGPLLILAGAGSGKTNTIVHRIANMLFHHRVNPEQILAISFTNKAADELRTRIRKLVGSKLANPMHTGTFHSICLKILKEHCETLGYYYPFIICGPGEQLTIINELAKNFRYQKGKFDKKLVLYMIGKLKNQGIDEQTFAQSEIDWSDDYEVICRDFYPLYQERLKDYNAFDFDDLLFKTVQLLEGHPEICQHYSEKYRYIMVDEYQDTNNLQFRFVRCLTQHHQNICVVGDDDQSIYGFRGANIQNILDFEKQFQDTKVIFLEQNYRSTTPILDLANDIIKENKNRKAKSLWTETSAKNRPILYRLKDPSHEAQFLVEQIDKAKREGMPYANMAVLTRSMKNISLLEAELKTYHIPYKVIGGQKIFDKKEVKDIMAYLSLIANSKDELSLRRVINTPTRGIGTTSTKKLIDLARSQKTTTFDLVLGKKISSKEFSRLEYINAFYDMIAEMRKYSKEHSLAELIEFVIERTQYMAYLSHYYQDSPNKKANKQNDLGHLIQLAKHFQSNNEKTGLRIFLEQMSLSEQNYGEAEEENDILTIMSLHASKGLEFDSVYLLGLEEEILPHKKSILSGEVEEERRLFYVGITRARKELFMTYCGEREFYEKKQQRHISRFLVEKQDLFEEQDMHADFARREQERLVKQKNFFADLGQLLD
jgi:superfamily I DNA/RNA helicase